MDEPLPRVVCDERREYRLFERFERSGMGEVYKAANLRAHGRPVVVKFLPQAARNGQDERRFRDEARQWAQLRAHPHIVSLFDSGEIDGRLFLEMEYVEGKDLADILVDSPISPPAAVRVVAQIGAALDWAHRQDLIHRDVKPANILVHRPDLVDRDDDLVAQLADFGIARKAATAEDLTIERQEPGTLRFMAPERFDPTIVSDHRVDVYSLACVLYECLTGRPAWPHAGLADLLYAKSYSDRPRPSAHAADGSSHLEPFDQVIHYGLASDRDGRPASTRKFAAMAWDALDAWRATQSETRAGGPATVSPRPTTSSQGGGTVHPGPAGEPDRVVEEVDPSPVRPTITHRVRDYLTSPVNLSGVGVGGGGAVAAATAYGGVGVGAVLIGALGYVAGAIGGTALSRNRPPDPPPAEGHDASTRR